MVYKSNYQKFLTSISEHDHAFSKCERKLAIFFRKNNEQLLKLNASDIAKQAEVSKSTVSRFIRKLGYTDFTEFRYLLQEKSQILPGRIQNQETDCPTFAFISRIKDEYNFLINQTISHIQQEDLTKFTNYLIQSQNIYIAGLGSSSFSAKEMSRKFIQLGFSFKILDEVSLILKFTLIMKKGDVFIVFSLRGESKYLLQAIKLAHEKDVHIILITNFTYSTLIKYSDCVFLATREMSITNNILVFPQFSQLFLIDILFHAVALSDTERFTEILQTMTESHPRFQEHYIAQAD